MITIEQYFGKFEHTAADTANAKILINRVNVLLADAVKHGVTLKENPKTKTLISGEQYGGFRPKDCPIGAKQSAHKLAMAIDLYDTMGSIDGYLDDIKLLKYDLYREHPEHTRGWCHLTTKPPKSGKRTFLP